MTKRFSVSMSSGSAAGDMPRTVMHASSFVHAFAQKKLCSALRLPRALRSPPIDALEQHRKLRRRQRHRATVGLWPHEAAALQAFLEQTQTIAAPPQQLHQVATPATKGEDVTGERILSQRNLHLRRQTVHAATHVGHARRKPHARASRQPNHGCDSSATTSRNTSPSMPPLSVTRPSGSAISSELALNDAARDWRSDINDTVGGVDGCACDSISATGSIAGAGIATACARARKCSRRHLNKILAFSRWSSAIRATEARGASVSSTRRRLNAASCVRRVANFGDAEALLCTRFMVCIIIDSAHHHGGHRVRACLLTRSTERRPPDDAYVRGPPPGT